MARLVIAAAVIVLAACSGPRLDRLEADAEAALVSGRLADADRLVAEGLAATSDEPDSVSSWTFRLQGAQVHLARLALPEAKEVLDARLPEGPEFAPLNARQKLLSARVQVLQGQLEAATQTLDAARRLAPDDRDLRYDAEILQSQIRYRTGQWDAAEQGLHALVAETESVGDRHRQAQALNNLGMGFLVRGRYDEAIPWFERVLALPDVAKTTIYGQSLNNAGICFARLGQFDRAVASQQRAIELHKGGRQLDYAQATGELGSTFFLSDDVPRGMSAWKEALRIATDAGLPDEAVLWARNLAAAAAQSDDWDAAERYNEQATRLAPTQSGSRRAFALVTSATIAAGRGRTDEAARLFDEAVAASEEVPSARWMSYDGLARLAAATNRPAEATRHFESALQTVEQTRSALLRADYRISFPSRLIRFYSGYVDFLLAQAQTERALEVADSSRARVLAERHSVAASERGATAASLRQLARRSGSTLLFYWMGPSRSWVWTVTGSRVTVRPLPPGPEIEALVTEHQAAIQNALADPLAGSGTAGDKLYEVLVRPVLAEAPPGASLVIVPDGALHRLNFETLPVPGERKHYWIEDVTVQIGR